MSLSRERTLEPAALTGREYGRQNVAGAHYEALGRNIARMIEEGGRALAAYMKPREEGKVQRDSAAEWTDLVKTLGRVMEYWLADPARTVELQSTLGKSYLDLWAA